MGRCRERWEWRREPTASPFYVVAVMCYFSPFGFMLHP